MLVGKSGGWRCAGANSALFPPLLVPKLVDVAVYDEGRLRPGTAVFKRSGMSTAGSRAPRQTASGVG